MLRLLTLACLVSFALSANILAIFPHTGKSHFDVYEPLVLALAARGHPTTVVSFFPQKTKRSNYTDISLVGLVPLRVSQVQFDSVEDPITDFIGMAEVALVLCEMILTHPPVQKLLHSDATFDLLIIEMFNTDCFLSLAHRFKAPYVAISSASTLPDQAARVGCPAHLRLLAHPELPLAPPLSLLQTLQNLFHTFRMQLLRPPYLQREQQLVHRLVDPTTPSLTTLAHRTSLILANTHHSILLLRPLPPNYVEVGGLHIHTARPLDVELEKFINESPEGVILFSMGSVLQSSSFPDKKRQAFMDAFAELPVRVIMKWENESLPGKPDNVRLSMWLPQRDILAHPKVLAFLGHGGLLSTSEAVYCGVPMVLVPMFGDQPNNVAHLQASGAAVKLPYEDISKEKILAALKAVLYDPRYRETARLLSAQFRDRPMSPLDTAVYWVEYVLRHQGAPHLQSPAVNMPWYQLWLLDVALALLIIPLVLLIAVWILTKRAVSIFCGAFQHNYPEQEKKTK